MPRGDRSALRTRLGVVLAALLGSIGVIAALQQASPSVGASPRPAAVATTTTAYEAPVTTLDPVPSTTTLAPPPPPPPVEDPLPAGTAQAASARRGGPAVTGTIEIPAIGLRHTTYEGIDLATINHGPSHWPGTPMPGQPGNTVFPGHRTTYSRPFWDIDRLRPGDEVVFTTAAGRFVYQVTETLVVGARDTWIINPTPDATFTIFGCHPKGSARQRYVAKGRLVSSAPTPPPPTTTTTAPPRQGGVGSLLG